VHAKPPLLELTSARFFAALVVLLGHFNDFLGLPEWFATGVAGGFGVSFFFVLSGFILAYRYWDDFSGGIAWRDLRRYLVARVARIYPPYVLALLIITALYLAANRRYPGLVAFPPDPVLSWLANLFALQTFAPSYDTQQVWNAPAWSISTEFGFYAACPFILAFTARRCASAPRLAALAVATLAYGALMQAATLVAVIDYGWDGTLWVALAASRNVFWRLPEFVIGVVAARLLYGGHLPWLARAGARNALLGTGCAVVLILNYAPWPQEHLAHVIERQFRLNLGYALPFAAIVIALAAGPTLVSPVLKRPFWVFLGDISYGVYIYHWIPWTVLAWAVNSGWILSNSLVAGVMLDTILFAAASYIWFERPARLYLRRKFGH
jgi:peptidoglycan/LPS O-acetylase OafA/YrhL